MTNEEAINVLRGQESAYWDTLTEAEHKAFDLAIDALALLKEQEADKPKTGHWIYRKYDDMFMCSSCEKYSIRNDYPYCHWCGADMRDKAVK